MSHPWPEVAYYNLAEELEAWEMHGAEEWASRTPVRTQQVPAYLTHRLLPYFEKHMMKKLFCLPPRVHILNHDDSVDPHYGTSNACLEVDLLLVAKGAECPVVLSYVDGKDYSINGKPTWTIPVFDGRRVLTRRKWYKGKEAVIVRLRYTDGKWWDHIPAEEIHQGGIELHHSFEQPYGWFCSAKYDEKTQELVANARELLEKRILDEGTVTESGIVDTSIRNNKIHFFPFFKYPDVAEYILEKMTNSLHQTCPRVETMEAFNRPNLQYGVYKPGEHYGWHKDGDYDSFTGRILSFSLCLVPADEGGELELEHVGPVSQQAGDMAIFPSYERHRVTEVVKGERHSIVGWFEFAHA